MCAINKKKKHEKGWFSDYNTTVDLLFYRRPLISLLECLSMSLAMPGMLAEKKRKKLRGALRTLLKGQRR